MARKTVAAQLVDVLAEAGVRRIYGVAGDSLNGITDSIRKSKQLEWAHMRHEEVAAFAAGAGSPPHGQAGGVRRQLRSGNLHLIKRPLRVPPQPCPGAGDRSADPQRGDRERLFPGDPSGAALRRVQPLLRAVSHPDQMPRVLEIAIQTAISRRGVSGW